MLRGVLGDTKTMVIKRFSQASVAVLALGGLLLGAGAILPRSPLIALAAGGSNKTSALGATEGSVADSKMMINPINFTYVAGAELSDASGEGHVYQLLLNGTPENTLKNAANALGVSGDVQRSSQWTPDSPAYFVGSEDGTGNSLNIWWGGTGSWYFNSFVAGEEPACKTKETAEDGSSYCAEYVEQKPTPELLPSENQIVKDALRIFNATGLSATAADLTVYKDEWSAGASASLKVAGQETSVTWNIGYDAKGRLAWAGGHSVKVVDRGSFATISAKAAVKRLSDWRWYGSPAASEFPTYVATRDLTSEQQPSEQQTEVTVTVNSSKRLLLQIWDKQFGSWLVPGFALSGNDKSSINFVVSLIEGVIELPEPIEMQPLVDPMVDQPTTK